MKHIELFEGFLNEEKISKVFREKFQGNDKAKKK